LALSFPNKSFWREHGSVGIWIILGLVHGLIYVFLVPPWQHYDEPGHFEYSWLIANRGSIPETGEYDQVMRREVAASMIEHRFFDNMGFQPNLLSQDSPIWIGIAQVGDSPFYYWLISLALRIVAGSDVAFQLIVGRLVSLALFLITIAVSYLFMVEITPAESPLRWVVPASVALLPAFTDLMTAVNNDVGAVAAFSLYLWMGTRLIRRGFTWKRLVSFLLFTALCYWTKNTVAIAVLLAPIPVLFSLLRGQRQRWAWAITGLVVAVALAGSITFQEPMYWYRTWRQVEPTRSVQSRAPHGLYAFEVVQTPESPQPRLYQIIPPKTAAELAGKPFTIGAWMWADEPVSALGPSVAESGLIHSQTFEIGIDPVFVAFTGIFSEQVDSLQVALAPFTGSVSPTTAVYYDGIVLIEGNHSLDKLPVFTNNEGTKGKWAGEYFENLVRNPSANKSWIRIRPQIEIWIDRFFPDLPSLILASLPDWRVSSGYYTATAHNVFQTFWAKFGWGHVPLDVSLVGTRPYRTISFFPLVGLAGAAIALGRRWRIIPFPVLFFLGAALVIVWGSVMVRGISSISGRIFIPSARYGFPAIIPSLLLLGMGWMEILGLFRGRFELKPLLRGALYLSFYALLALVSIISIARFYGE
jgi:hypothetical protein